MYDALHDHFIADFIGDGNLIRGHLSTHPTGRLFTAKGLVCDVTCPCALAEGAAVLSERPQHWHMAAVNSPRVHAA